MPENADAIEVFRFAINKVEYDPNGKAIGFDLDTVIELIKLIEAQDPIGTLEKVMFLGKEICRG